MQKTMLIGAALCAALICPQAHAQYDNLDAYMQRMDELKKYTGTLLLASNDKLLYEKAFGPATADGATANTTKSAYHIGSVTKSFTSSMVLLSVEAGKMALDDSLAKWFPRVKNADKITIKHLLSQTSGIANYTEQAGMTAWKYRDNSQKDVIDFIASLPAEFTPGDRFKYSNSNYYLLGAILEKVHGKPYHTLLDEMVAIPHELRSTGVFIADKKAKLSEGVSPTPTGWELVPAVNVSLPMAAGAVYSTAPDVLNFSRSLFGGSLFKETATLELMRKPVKGGYGLGLFELEIAGENAIGHNGGIDGYSSLWMYLPDLKLHIVSLSNNFITDHMAVAEAAVRIHRGEPVELPVAKQATMVSAELLQRYAGAYSLDAGFLLNVSVEAGSLACEVPGQAKVQLNAANDTTFFSQIYNLEIDFRLAANGEEVEQLTLHQAGMSFVGKPFSLPDQMVTVPLAKLERLKGVYEMQPGFDLTVYLEGQKLMAQATGQGAFELIAENDTRFFATVAPIDIQFEMGDDGNAKALLLKQAGQVTYAERKEEAKDKE